MLYNVGRYLFAFFLFYFFANHDMKVIYLNAHGVLDSEMTIFSVNDFNFLTHLLIFGLCGLKSTIALDSFSAEKFPSVFISSAILNR